MIYGQSESFGKENFEISMMISDFPRNSLFIGDRRDAMIFMEMYKQSFNEQIQNHLIDMGKEANFFP